jgi:hypothetical protein
MTDCLTGDLTGGGVGPRCQQGPPGPSAAAPHTLFFVAMPRLEFKRMPQQAASDPVHCQYRPEEVISDCSTIVAVLLHTDMEIVSSWCNRPYFRPIFSDNSVAIPEIHPTMQHYPIR